MGTFEFGIYVYVWTWVMLLGQAIDLELGTAAQRFIPEYRERGMVALLRDFVSGSRWVAIGVAILHFGGRRRRRVAVGALSPPLLGHPALSRLHHLAGLCDRQPPGGISRSYDWVGLAMMPSSSASCC